MKKSKKKFKDILLNSFLYFVVFAIFYPRGLNEVMPEQKAIFTIVTWSAVMLIWLQLAYAIIRKKDDKIDIKLFSYFIITIITTILLRGIAINGMQKLFAYPSFFLFTLHNFKYHPKELLNTACNTTLVLSIINLIYNPEIFHTTFLGHVQLIAQFGLLSIFCNLAYYRLYNDKKIRTILSTILILATMFMTDALSSNITAALITIIAICALFSQKKPIKINIFISLLLWLAFSTLIVFVSVSNNKLNHNESQLLDFSGRSYVWISAIDEIEKRPIIGYGIEGATIDVFWKKWSDSKYNFNYAHNQLLQVLLDGGIISLIAFFMMLHICTRKIKDIKDDNMRNYTTVVLLFYILIMLFESPSLYSYMFVFLAMCYRLPQVSNKQKMEIEKMEIITKLKNIFNKKYYASKVKK